MLFLGLSLLLCACANGLVGDETRAGPTLVYETYADAGRYLLNPGPQNWTDASKVCRMYNGHLAYPKTQEEADALWAMMAPYNIQQVHAGFHDQFVDGEYYTAKGRPIDDWSFNKWSAGYPRGGVELNCGGLRGDGFVDVPCQDSLPSICEKTDPTELIGGFLEYEFISGHGYYKHVKKLSIFSDALKHCSSEGSHLWIPNSAEEQTVVLTKFNVLSIFDAIWVGFHQLHAYRYFVTIFDDTMESVMGDSKWMVGQPAGSHTEYPYVSISIRGYSAFLESNHEFICEYNHKSF